ncbi:MAG TPA: recombinase family protein [Baekduia sp.]|uniref:recombinase family protein n=1 Tax=Baekduia sp. TaxID=2600305 RepID=UPI002D7A0ED1|nr:recombinase family protein [Baekduia sp.]HET6510182.1 recombinase family protein [Baekduia sp.]
MRTQTLPVPTPNAVPALGFAADPRATGELAAACARFGIDLLAVTDDDPLDALDADAVGCLVVGSLGDLPDVTAVLERVDADGLRLIALDIGLDTAADTGRVALRRRSRPLPPWLVPARDEPDDEPGEGTPDAAAEPIAPEPEPEPEIEPEPEQDPEPEPEEEPEPEREPEPVAAPAPAPVRATRAIGYASAAGSRDHAALDMRRQRAAIESCCGRPDLDLVELVGDRESREGKALDRPGLSHVLQRIAAGEASCVVVTGLDHLSRSVAELGRLIDWLDRMEVRLVALDLDLDTSTPHGRTAARALASVGAWERERLSERTRAGLAAARAKRHKPTGAAAQRTAELHRRIAAMRADGMTLQAIADVLNGEGVPTLRGGAKWRPSSVQSAAGYKRPKRTRLPESDT